MDIYFGPFTCIAGANGIGKSNLFDAITFLGSLASKTFLEAAQGVRDEQGRTGDVPTSFKWYQALFGQPATLPVHDYFGQIFDSDGTVLLCLHEWGAHEHPSLMSPNHGTPGNGLLLFFRVDDFDLALQRARALVTRFEEEAHVNPNTQTKEFSLRDPDGYWVTISALSLKLDEW